MPKADLLTGCNPSPRPSLDEKLVEQLILKGMIFLGAEVGLYIAQDIEGSKAFIPECYIHFPCL